MHTRIIVVVLFFLLTLAGARAQDQNRIEQIRNQLELMAADTKGLSEPLNVTIQNASLSDYLLAISKIHGININVSPELEAITLANNFTNVTVSDLLVYLCAEYSLDIEFSGNILTVQPYEPPPVQEVYREILVDYNSEANTLSMDLQSDRLDEVFRKIMDLSGKNLLYDPVLANTPLRIYIKEVPFDLGLAKLAETNGLVMEKSRDGFYAFRSAFDTEFQAGSVEGQELARIRPQRRTSSNFYYKVLDYDKQLLEVDFVNTPIEDIINGIGTELNINFFTASPLSNAGTITFKKDAITFDALLHKIFESQERTNTVITSRNVQENNYLPPQQNGLEASNAVSLFTFKKEDNTYFFGTTDQLSVQAITLVPLMHRSIQLLGDPMQSGTNRQVGRTLDVGFPNFTNSNLNPNLGINQSQNSISARRNRQGSFGDELENQNEVTLLDVIPDEVKKGLEIKADVELNSFILSGPEAYIRRFKAFVKEIDKPVPVILIETMFIDVSKIYTVSTGISWGIGDEPVPTQGELFPTVDLTLGAGTINRVLGGISGLGTVNVVPEFYAQIRAMEDNGDVKILSTPKVSTLNGHRASFSNGETTYYAITNVNIIGTDNPQTSETRNYQPIDAELAINIRPFVSGDGQITLDISVIQSDFTGERIEDDAPPNQVSREFSSIIRVRDQDLVVLGGLEEKTNSDTGTGIPFLSRIPIIKWFFSSRTREDSKRKLTVLIKPTVIN